MSLLSSLSSQTRRLLTLTSPRQTSTLARPEIMSSPASSSAILQSATSGWTVADSGGSSLLQNASDAFSATAPLTAANLATHRATDVARPQSESTASSRTSFTLSYLEGLDEGEFSRRLEELRLDRYAAIARLRTDARPAQDRTHRTSKFSASSANPGDTGRNSDSDNNGIGTPSATANTPSDSSDDNSSTVTSTPSCTTDSTERGETFGQKLAKYLLSESHGGEVLNLKGWQELCLASGAAVGTIKEMNVNIFDVIEALQTEKVAGWLVDLETLGKYSIEHAKIMEKRVAKANPMLRAFMRNFGSRGGETRERDSDTADRRNARSNGEDKQLSCETVQAETQD